MATVTETTPPTIVNALRGERATRPLMDTSSAGVLRAFLEDEMYQIYKGQTLCEPRVLRASSLRQPLQVQELSFSPLARIRGIVVVHLLRLMSVGLEIVNPLYDAVDAWRSTEGSSDLLAAFDALETESLSRLEADVHAHCVTLRRALGTITPGWLPRSSVRSVQRFAGENVILRDVVDLMVGSTTSERASVALFDVTTSPLGPGDERAIRYHALLQTLRTGVLPLRTSCFSTATGELWSTDVSFELVTRSAGEVITALREREEAS